MKTARGSKVAFYADPVRDGPLPLWNDKPDPNDVRVEQDVERVLELTDRVYPVLPKQSRAAAKRRGEMRETVRDILGVRRRAIAKNIHVARIVRRDVK